MSKEYIDKDLVIQKLELRLITTKLCEDNVYKKGQIDARTENLDVIKYMPAADVESVRHGKWRLETNDEEPNPMFKLVVCSNCNSKANHTYPYCPHCGAKMDGGK